MKKFDGGFSKTETIKQVQSFVKLPDQLFTCCLLLLYEKQTLFCFFSEGTCLVFLLSFVWTPVP